MAKMDSVQRFAMPSELSLRDFGLRSEREGDSAFLESLYIAVRWPELEASGWTNEAKLGFLREQFSFQDKHYAEHYAEAEFLILEKQGVPVGRLYLYRASSDIRIVDISLMPEVRNLRIGTALLQGVTAEAAEAGQSVSIHVEKFNPAQTLYRRLGFKEIGENGPYWLMEWTEANARFPKHQLKNGVQASPAS